MKRSTLVLGLIVLAGCAHFQNRARDVQIFSQRIALMPLIVTAYELDFSDDRETKADWEDAMERGLTVSLERRVAARAAALCGAAGLGPSLESMPSRAGGAMRKRTFTEEQM